MNFAKRALSVICIAVGLSACAVSPVGPAFIQPPIPTEARGAEPYDPPEYYEHWWAAMQECLGIPAQYDFDHITWYQINKPIIYTNERGDRAVGFVRYYPPRVWVAVPFKTVEDVITHEMVHLLLRFPGHSKPPFGICAPVAWGASHTWEPGRDSGVGY